MLAIRAPLFLPQPVTTSLSTHHTRPLLTTRQGILPPHKPDPEQDPAVGCSYPDADGEASYRDRELEEGADGGATRQGSQVRLTG